MNQKTEYRSIQQYHHDAKIKGHSQRCLDNQGLTVVTSFCDTSII